MSIRFIEARDFVGVQKVRILRGVVAAGKPRQVGEIVELPTHQAFELVCTGQAEAYVPGPAFASLE